MILTLHIARFPMLPAINNVRPIVRDFELRMRKVLEAAWDEWMRVPDRGRFSARSRASIVFDFIRAGAIDEFDGDPDVRVILKGQTVHYLFRDCVLIRFKKANESGMGSNIETQSVLDFIDPQFAFPNMLPDIFHVEVCYHLDELKTRIDLLAVTARRRHKRLWSYELERRPSAEIVPVSEPHGGNVSPLQIRVRTPKHESDANE